MSAALRRALASIVGPEDPHALGLLRILVVSVLLGSLLSHAGAVAAYFSSASTIPMPWAQEAFHSRWSLFFWVHEPWAVRAVFAVGVAAHVAWLLGWHTAIAGVLSWLLWASMVGRNPLLYALPDQLQMVLCALLAVMPTGRGLSLDARRRGVRPVPRYCRGIVQLQIAVVYLSTGLLKTGATWRADGTALYYSISNPYNRHFDLGTLPATLQPWVLRPMTWLVLAFEVGFAAFLVLNWLRAWVRRVPDLRAVFLGFGAAMHLGIQALMFVAWFTPMMLASYAAFLQPDEARRLVDWVRRRMRSRSAQ